MGKIIKTIGKNINDPTVKTAKKLFDTFKVDHEYNQEEAIKIIYLGDKRAERSIINIATNLNNGTISIKQAKFLIRKIEKINEEENNLNIRKDIYFDDISDFFLSENIGKAFDKEKGENIAGLYLLFRKSNVDESKIIVSYFKVEFENNKLHFESKRNNLDSKDHVRINIKTKGIIIKNTRDSFLCLGISKNIISNYAKQFVESITIYINHHNYDIPISGYWCGSIVQGANNNPFVNKIVLVKIQNQDSKKEIESEIDRLNENKVLKLHERESLLCKENTVNQIINIESDYCNGIYKMDGVLNNLDLKLNELGFFSLERFS